MSKDLWSSVDLYIEDALLPRDPALDAALKANASAGLPAIDVAPNQGKLLYLLAQMMGAQRILEIGTLGGYSTIWLARALPSGGKIVTLEFEPRHAEVARANVARAGLAHAVEIKVGAALETLPLLEGQVFDLVFIDADKPNNPHYLAWALRLTRPGSVIIVDNVVRNGSILDEKSQEPRVVGTRKMFEAIGREPRLSATKGYDGFVIARVVAG